MIKNEWKSLWNNKILIIVVMAIIVIPVIYAGLFLKSMWDPYGNLDKLPVAVVNNDKSVEYNGKTLSVGSDMVDELKDNDSLDFHFVDSDEAEQGLKNGTYYMVITIPEDFSSDASTLMDDNPKKMELKYETNPGTNYIASKMSETALSKIREAVASKVTETYTQTVFDQIGTVGDGMQEAADGSTELKDGLTTASDGNKTITTNLKKLADSTLTFKSGAETLTEGLKEYTDGVSQVDSGAAQLDEGVGRTHQTHDTNFLAAGEDGDFDGVGNDDHRNDCQNQHDDSANGRNCLLQIGEDGCLLARRADVRVYPIDFQQLLLNRIEGRCTDILELEAVGVRQDGT